MKNEKLIEKPCYFIYLKTSWLKLIRFLLSVFLVLKNLVEVRLSLL